MELQTVPVLYAITQQCLMPKIFDAVIGFVYLEF